MNSVAETTERAGTSSVTLAVHYREMRAHEAPLLLLPSSIMSCMATTGATSGGGAQADVQPPMARQEAWAETVHGQQRSDEYHWLRRKDAPEVLSYLRDENTYTEAVMKPTAPLQGRLYDEMLGRIKEDDSSVPAQRGPWLYYSRMEKGKQYAIHCRKRGSLAATEEVLLDLNEIGAAAKYVGLGVFELSDDGRTLAFGLDTTGFRQYTLAFKDLATGAVAAERIPRVTSAAFARDGKTIFYVVEDETTKRPQRLYRHTVGTDAAGDALLYDETDEMFSLWVERSRSRDFVFVTSASKTTSEVRFLNSDRPGDSFSVMAPREHDHEYYADHRGDSFVIRTNSGGRNFRVCTALVANPIRSGWREIVPHREHVMIENVDTFATFIVLHEREDALPHLSVHDDRTKKTTRIPLPEAIYTLAPDENHEFVTRSFRYSYNSPVTPRTVYDFDVDGGGSALLKRWEVPGGYDPANYHVVREHAIASDGTRIPLSIVARKGVEPGTPHPLLLYGYGSYGMAMPASFSSNRVSLLDRGVVFVIAHIRGGGDLGKRWHDEGRMMNKMNSFTDFIAAGEHLISRRWTAPDRLVIQGGSAGGLLVGAVVNLRPDLMKAAVLQVPFVDVINTMLDESLPLTVGEFEEWGNPKAKPAYDYMMRYSPYDNIEHKRYPSILVKTSYNDSQVMYWEPAKYVARMRARKTDVNPLLFKINLEPAGHGGQSGRYNQLRELAFEYAFILGQLGR